MNLMGKLRVLEVFLTVVEYGCESYKQVVAPVIFMERSA